MPHPFGKPCAAALDGIVPQPAEERIETRCQRRDVDNKDVNTIGVTLSRSRSNGIPASCLIASG
jgi:hypothetical protein